MSLIFQDDAVGNLQLGINSKEFGSNLPELVITSGTSLSVGNSDYNKNELLVYPVPVSDVINLVLPQNSKSKLIVLYNAFGQIVLQKSISSSEDIITLDVSNLGAGIYTLQVIGEQNFVKKIIKK